MAQNKPQYQIPSKMLYNGQELETEESIAQGFADFFKQKVEDITIVMTVKQNVFNGEKKVDTESENFFTEEKVKEVMKTLKDKSSYWSDNIPVKVIKDAHKILVKPYHKLLNKVYNQNIIPE